MIIRRGVENGTSKEKHKVEISILCGMVNEVYNIFQGILNSLF